MALKEWDQRCVADAVTFARALIDKHGIEPEHILVEHRLDGKDLGLVNGGTADLILVVPFRLVVVVDWKFGFIDQEDADEHDQLVAYALMASRTFKTWSIGSALRFRVSCGMRLRST
jgi:RecB family exonuclease